MNLQFTSSHTRVYISEMTGTVFRAPCQTCLSVFPTGESAEPPFTMRKEGLVTIVTRFRAHRPCRILLGMSSEFAPRVVCVACGQRVVDLGRTACVQDSFGCHLVCELAGLDEDIMQLRPHPEAAKFPFKQGKLACKCKANLGNIHNNVTALLPVAGLTGRGDYAILKFVDVSFAVTPSKTVPQLTGALLGQAVGFASGKGGGRALGGKGGRGQSSSRAVSVTMAHVLQAAGKTDALKRILEATEKRRNLNTTSSVLTSAGGKGGGGAFAAPPPAPASLGGINGMFASFSINPQAHGPADADELC